MVDISGIVDNDYLNLKKYETSEKRFTTINNVKFEIRLFKGIHCNEYLVSEVKGDKIDGRCQLFNRGILSRAWTIRDDKEVVEATRYDHGKVVEKESWHPMADNTDTRVIENTKDGLIMVIRAKAGGDNSGRVIYRGEFDEEMNRNGYGMEFDPGSGKEKLEGYWEKDTLIRIFREFTDDNNNSNTMIEYSEEENAELCKRIPVYIGGYCYDHGSYKRNGRGYLINERSGTASRESVWENGKEISGTDLHEGWYLKGTKESIRGVVRNEKPEKQIRTSMPAYFDLHTSTKVNQLNLMQSDLVVPNGSYAYMNKLSFNGLSELRSIEIGDDCFAKVDAFRIDGLNRLTRLTIGRNSFTQLKTMSGVWSESKGNTSQSFSITHCEALSHIIIGENSFSTFAGAFELKSLPSLQTLQIGSVGKKSYNFYNASFVLQSRGLWAVRNRPACAAVDCSGELFVL